MLYCEKNGCICTFRPSFGAVVARAQLSPVGPSVQITFSLANLDQKRVFSTMIRFNIWLFYPILHI